MSSKNYVAEQLNQAISWHQQGNINNALRMYQQVLVVDSRNFTALHYMGILYGQMGRFDDALVALTQACDVQPGDFAVHFNRGKALHELKRYDEALASYDKAISLNPNYVDAYNNKGIVLDELRRHDEALISFDKALLLNPNLAEVHNNRGNVLKDLQRYKEALASFGKAITLNNQFAEAYNNRGVVLKALWRLDEALSDVDKAITHKFDYAEAHANRGNVFKELHRYEEALASYDQSIALNSNQNYVYGGRLLAQLSICDWQDFEPRVAEIQQRLAQHQAAALPFHLLAAPFSAQDLKLAATLYAAEEYPAAAQPLWQGERYTHDRIRLGYFSADFHQHATAYLIAELFERHDRSRFELYGYSFGPSRQDAMRQRLVKGFDHFFDVADHSSAAIAALARQHEIDIAIDLKGYTQDSRPDIFARRPAPIQVNYLGFPGTMGVPYIDYLIADRVIIPQDQFENYCEKIVQLPHSYQVNDRQRPIAATTADRRGHGLPDTGFVFCCFNNNYKITPDLFVTWMQLLKQVPGSVLWLLEGNASIGKNLRQHAHDHGIDPDRLIFAPRMPHLAEHLARHRHADLFLDTFYCNAHTTTSDALWAGLPVLTCLGTTFASRVAASLLTAIGLPELITHTHEQYHALALKLATHPAELKTLKQTLDHNRLSQPLFDTPLFTHHLEAAYLAMWQRQQQGLVAEHIVVAE
jgi:predicted O-linked N-acetylglucosamine transferase (SPINDLY family)